MRVNNAPAIAKISYPNGNVLSKRFGRGLSEASRRLCLRAARALLNYAPSVACNTRKVLPPFDHTNSSASFPVGTPLRACLTSDEL